MIWKLGIILAFALTFMGSYACLLAFIDEVEERKKLRDLERRLP